VAKSVKSRLNQTTSGFQFTNCAGDIRATAEVTKDQQRTTENSSSSGCCVSKRSAKHGQANERVLLQLTRNVKTVFAQTSPARGNVLTRQIFMGPLRASA